MDTAVFIILLICVTTVITILTSVLVEAKTKRDVCDTIWKEYKIYFDHREL